MYTHPIQVFGDESHFQGSITYALVIVPRSLLETIEKTVIAVKESYGVPQTASIHCSVLFNEEKKSKSPFSHLSFDASIALLADVTREAYIAGARGWIGYLESSTTPEKMGFEIDTAPGKVEWFDTSSIKARTVFTAQAAMGPVANFIGHKNVQAWIDHETTKIALLHSKKERVDQLVRFFPIDHEDIRFQPLPVSKNKPIFLEVADVLAYSASHALCKGVYKKRELFEQIVNAMRPGYSEVLFLDSPAGERNSVRAFDRDDQIKNYLIPFVLDAQMRSET